MSCSTWTAAMETGVRPLDELHRGLLDELARLSTVRYDEFESAFGIFVQKVERAFIDEELWMEEIGFPDLKSHREQHARVLSALHQVHSRVMQGDQGDGRHVVEELLPDWFAFHISTMDTALGAAVQASKAKVKAKASRQSATLEYID